MPYPRHLELEEEIESKLTSWFETELTNHLSERGEWVEQLIRYQTDYNAEPSTKVATFPFQGASTIIVPLTAIALEATFARTMQTLYALDLKVAARIYTDQSAQIETPLEQYLDQVLFNDINLPKQLTPALLELHKLGTGVASAEYQKITRKGTRVRDGEEEDFEVVIREGPTIESTAVVNFLMPFESIDPQTARWCGKVFWLTPNEIYNRERDGYFKKGTYEELKRYYTSGSTTSETQKYLNKLEENSKQEPSWPTRVEFFEVFTAWDIDKEVWGHEIVFVYHRESQTIPAIWNNWYEDLRRPYRIGCYFPLEHRWHGIGIGKQNEMFQQEATTIHRQRLDNGTISNLRMFKINRNATEITPDEPLFPGKLWFLDNMDDVQPLEMGDVKVSAYNNENQVMLLSQQRTGVNELTLGMPQMGTPGTATDSAARVQESGRKADYIYHNCRDFNDILIQDTLCNIVQWGPDMKRLRLMEQGSELELFLKQPYEMFRNKVYCIVGLVGQNQNQIVDRQNATQVAGLLKQYYTEMLTLAQQVNDPALVAEAARKAMEGANEALLQILPLHNIRNPQNFLIKLPSANGNPQQTSPISGGQAGSEGTSSDVTINNSSIMAPGLTSVLPQGAGQF